MTTDDNTEVIYEAESAFDRAAAEADALKGVRAYSHLLNHSGEDWVVWADVVRGLRGLRDIAFADAHTSDIHSYAYRQQMGFLLKQPRFAMLSEVKKTNRSAAYRMMDHLDEISAWYQALPGADKLDWKTPQTIALHCPPHFLSGGKGHNQPKKTGKKKRGASAEEDRLRQLLVLIINEFVLTSNPQRATELLKVIYPEGDPDDSLEDLGGVDDDFAEIDTI